MDSFDTQSLHALTDEQMGMLVSIALDEFGLGLTRTQFNKVMLALFEHIPGFETLPHSRNVRYLKLLWLKYQQTVLVGQHRH